MNVPSSTRRVVVSGDSITAPGVAWQAQAGGFNDQMTALIPPLATYRRLIPPPGLSRPNTGFLARAPLNHNLATKQNTIQTGLTGYGIPGRGIVSRVGSVGLVDDQYYSIRIWDPEFLVLEIMINDFVNGTTALAFQTAYANVLDTTIAWKSTIKILCMGGLMDGEQWSTSGGNHFLSGLTTNVYDPIIQALCAARPANCEYVDQKGWALTYETVNNTPAPGVNQGILTVDSVHPNPTAKLLMGNHVMAQVTVTP